LPPSTNVLAHVAEALARADDSGTSRDDIVTSHFRALLEQSSGPALDAWMIPSQRRSALEETQWRWRHGTLTNEVEYEGVVKCYDIVGRYYPDLLSAEARAAAIGWIERLQCPDGSWGSRPRFGAWLS